MFNNSDAADLLLPEGRFDRYYFAFDEDMSNVSISGGSPGLTANATVTPRPAGYEIPLSDLFGTGYPLPITLPNGGFVLELGGGTDLTELGQTISVDFGCPGVSVYNSFEDATLTGGQQAFYGAAGPVGISSEVEFPQFINFYDIDVDDCGLTMTLFNNSDAADLLLPEGRFDRYYFAFDQDMSNVSISGGSSGLVDNATVTPLPAGYEIPLEDLFGTGYPLPIILPNGGFVLELSGGTDLTELGQTISVDFGCPGVSVYNSFEDATLTGGQQAFYGAAGPVDISNEVEFPQFINFYDIDVEECGLTMTLFNNSDAADLLLPDGRFDRYYFAFDQDMSNVSISGGSPGLTDNATVTPLPAGYEIPLADLFGTGYPLPIILPNGGFVLELGGGTDLTELGQTISVDFGCPTPEILTIPGPDFFPEDITVVNDIAYVSGLGDGTVRMFDLSDANPTADIFANAEAGYTQAWGVKSDGTVLLSLLNNANFFGGESGPAKLVEYNLASGEKTGEWDLPAGAIGHTVSIVDGKYYVTDFGSPRIFEVDPAMGTVNDSWFTSTEWDPAISGIGGTIYDDNGGFYISQGNKLWYLPISGGTPGALQEVSVTGLDIIDADGITWVGSQNTLYFATNDTGDPANVGTVSRLVFSDATTAGGSVIASDFDDASGLWYYEDAAGDEYLFLCESQFGALFGINEFDPPFNIEIIPLDEINNVVNTLAGTTHVLVSPNPFSQMTAFKIDLNLGGEFQFQVFDMNGRELNRKQLQLSEETNQFIFDGSALTPGFYSYRLSNQQGFVSGKMVVVR
ncbi:MAG: T9SS type A sorting domain-containing protein [Bacteroidota bacterium]